MHFSGRSSSSLAKVYLSFIIRFPHSLCTPCTRSVDGIRTDSISATSEVAQVVVYYVHASRFVCFSFGARRERVNKLIERVKEDAEECETKDLAYMRR
jgi:hypothetical protein